MTKLGTHTLCKKDTWFFWIFTKKLLRRHVTYVSSPLKWRAWFSRIVWRGNNSNYVINDKINRFSKCFWEDPKESSRARNFSWTLGDFPGQIWRQNRTWFQAGSLQKLWPRLRKIGGLEPSFLRHMSFSKRINSGLSPLQDLGQNNVITTFSGVSWAFCSSGNAKTRFAKVEAMKQTTTIKADWILTISLKWEKRPCWKLASDDF